MNLKHSGRFKNRNGKDVWNRYGFILFMMSCMLLASIQPNLGGNNGIINGHVAVWYIAVPLTYIEAGLICSSKSLYAASTDVYLLSFISIFMYIIMPLLARVSSCFLALANVNTWLLKGMEVFYCMPPPLSIGIVLTRIADGDVSTSVITILLTHSIGVLVSPILLYLMLGASTPPLVGVNIQEIIYSTLVPFGVGLILQTILKKFNYYNKLQTSWIPIGSLFITTYICFSEAMKADSSALQAVDILLCVLIACLGQMLITGICWILCSRWLSRSILIAAIFTIIHKSVGLGGWILRGAYHGSSHGSAVNLPLSILPVAQLLLGSILACWIAP